MDWSRIDERMAREIFKQGEIFLQATLTVGSGLDQRSAALAGIFSASATAALGVSAAIHFGENPDRVLTVCGLAVATTWLLGAALCVAALWPSKYHLPGNHPRNWWDASISQGSIIEAIGGESENYQERIDYNVNGLRRDSRFLKWGAAIGCSAPVIGALTWLVISWAWQA